MKFLFCITAFAALAACSRPEGALVYSADGVSVTVHIVEKDGHKFAVASSDIGGVSICEVSK